MNRLCLIFISAVGLLSAGIVYSSVPKCKTTSFVNCESIENKTTCNSSAQSEKSDFYSAVYCYWYADEKCREGFDVCKSSAANQTEKAGYEKKQTKKIKNISPDGKKKDVFIKNRN